MKFDIYGYTSSLQFMIDFYKGRDFSSDVSLRLLSKEMGFESPILLLDLLKKKRPLKLKFADNLAVGMKLEGNEKIYFKTLILWEKAEREEKTYYQDVLESLRPQGRHKSEAKGIYSHWLHMVVFSLGQIQGFKLTPKNIQSSLLQPLPLEQIEESLKVLHSNGYIEHSLDGSYSLATQSSITTKNDVIIESVHNYYRQIITESEKAVALDIQEREFQCFAIGMQKKDLAKVKEVIRTARRDISSFQTTDADHVYQFNLGGFPMAEIIQ